MKKTFVRLIDEDGTEYRSIITWEEITDLLHLVKWLKEKVSQISFSLKQLEDYLISQRIETAKQEILEFLRENPNIETRKLNKFLYLKNYRFEWQAFSRAFEALVAEGIVESVSQGRGKNRLWKIKKKERKVNEEKNEGFGCRL
ncbi:hypothetical protein DRH14_05085 [Candidatus Shapirobacteria bacterium]|nr:MAG: hypothetical protein DRH14_05085 [Candidatus Shapirobacteria bacterium]